MPSTVPADVPYVLDSPPPPVSENVVIDVPPDEVTINVFPDSWLVDVPAAPQM